VAAHGRGRGAPHQERTSRGRAPDPPTLPHQRRRADTSDSCRSRIENCEPLTHATPLPRGEPTRATRRIEAGRRSVEVWHSHEEELVNIFLVPVLYLREMNFGTS